MKRIQLCRNQTGLTLGILFVLLHVTWITMVALGFGQTLIDWWYTVHGLTNPFVVAGLSLTAIFVGIIKAFIFGYIVGWILALIWNLVGKKLK